MDPPKGSPPADEEFGIKPGKEGVMCKSSCIKDVDFFLQPFFSTNGDSILRANYYSEPNKNRILNLDEDYLDGEGKRRNLRTVATAANNDDG
jgi:hypothetical protein